VIIALAGTLRAKEPGVREAPAKSIPSHGFITTPQFDPIVAAPIRIKVILRFCTSTNATAPRISAEKETGVAVWA